jgi:serine/threonine-protein kinase
VKKPIQFGRYTLLSMLGAGGMAEVWEASLRSSEGFERTVAIKRILSHYSADPLFRKMFVREARISARLHHPNIVSVFDFGEVDGAVYLAMERVHGRTLTALVRAHLRGQTLPEPGLAAFVLRDVCRALGYAHKLTDRDGAPVGLVHRDISPANVMISEAGAVKLLDFGVAKALQERREELTEAGTVKGKQPYMAPEQLAGHPIDARADIFAAGVVLHETLTGRRLYAPQRGIIVRGEPVPPPSTLRADVTPALDAICARALAERPEDRYPDADEMAADLEAVVHELRWGPERLAGELRTLDGSEASVDAAASESTTRKETPTPGQEVAVSPRRGRVGRWAFGVASLGALGVAIAAWPRTRPVEVATPPAATAPAPIPAAVLPTPPDPKATVVLRIESQPPGATVHFDDEAEDRGTTPLALTLPRGDEPHSVHITSRGYDVYRANVTLDQDRQLLVALRKERPHAVRQKTPAHAVAKRPALRSGGTVDPFTR